MSGIGGSEFLLLCLIGLLILGPERLPRVARQLGGWLGKARRMTRALQRQLEEELDMEKNIGINPKDLSPDALLSPRDEESKQASSDDGGDGETPRKTTG
ncbi:MAG: Sec-independent protein translocase protein TatB [Gammaproteobacteria bacterium]|nr:Sec-independent protein translocase protein TatB [Gammaproteobacteria bacterium]